MIIFREIRYWKIDATSSTFMNFDEIMLPNNKLNR